MACDMVGQTHLEAALSAYIFEYLVTTAVARKGENMTVLCQPLVFLNDTLENVQRADVRFGVGLISSGDYPQVAVEECLQAVEMCIRDRNTFILFMESTARRLKQRTIRRWFAARCV